MTVPRLLSVNVGLPRDIEWRGQIVHTAIWKSAVKGPQMVRRLNVEGDGQGDLAGHGGEHRAVFVYQTASYRYWASELGRDDFVMGQFGENFTVDGLADDEVCIGDRYRIGSASFEVTQPRVTCYRVGMRMDNPQMPALLVARGRPGFYFRVLEQGEVEAGDAIEKLASGPEGMKVAEINALLYLPGKKRTDVERALRIPALSDGWRNSFRELLERDGQPEIRASRPPTSPAAWSGFRRVRVAELARAANSVFSLELEAADGAVLTAPLPGQFVILRLRLEPDAAPVMRSFSICGTPSPTRYRLGIKHEPNGAVGTYLAERAHVGDELEVSAPRGAFVLQPGERPVVLLSAGIGVTPVLAMLQALAAERSTRAIWWLYAARNGAEHPFADEVRGLLAALPQAHEHVRYSRPAADDLIGHDFQSSGHLDVTQFSQLRVARDGEFYICGPPTFLDGMRTGLIAWGVDAQCVHGEIFGSGPSLTPGIVGGPHRVPHPPAGTPGTGPLVSFARSNLSVPWNASAQSLLELAEACDVPVRWACRTGVCHSCETGLVSGAVRYGPDPLEPPAAGNLLLCCSQPEGDVVLDL